MKFPHKTSRLMRFRTSLAVWCAVCLASCTTTAHRGKIVPVDHVDLLRFMGSWRIIACTDNKLERDFVDAVETYQLRSDGRIGVHFEWREKNFNAHVKTHDFTGSVVADGSNARWKMRLLPLFSASYLIVHVLPDYSIAAVAHPSRKFGWVLARERRISESQYGDLMQIFQGQGYDTSKFIRVPQQGGAPYRHYSHD